MLGQRIMALAAVLVGGSVGLAGPAWAEPLSGDYTMTVTDSNFVKSGATQTWVFTPCGPDCSRMQRVTSPRPDIVYEFHLQGNTWSNPDDADGEPISIDAASLAVHGTGAGIDQYYDAQLSKN